MKYDSLTIMESIVAAQNVRFEVDVPPEGGAPGWQRGHRSIDSANVEGWADLSNDLREGSRHLMEETWVPANDPHMDAKCFPSIHPYGTGSLLSEVGSGGTQHHARNRLMSLQSWFRRNPIWGFWFQDRLIKTELFFKHQQKKKRNEIAAQTDEVDSFTRIFGSAQPADIPETTAWWRRRQGELFAMSDDGEMGLMQCMVTITQNDSAAENLAAIRRGPFSLPTESERIEYLLGRKDKYAERPRFENFSLEHVLSFQRRVQAAKTQFMRRGKTTPLGNLREWWDRNK